MTMRYCASLFETVSSEETLYPLKSRVMGRGPVPFISVYDVHTRGSVNGLQMGLKRMPVLVCTYLNVGRGRLEERMKGGR